MQGLVDVADPMAEELERRQLVWSVAPGMLSLPPT